MPKPLPLRRRAESANSFRMTKPRKPIKNPPAGLRQRWRARSNDWRVWWEPNATQRAAGFEPVELNGSQPTWSIREAEKLNLQAGGPPKPDTRRAAATGKHAIDTICSEYLQSPRYLNLAAKTQSEYRKDINRILDKWGGTDLRKMTKPVAHTWYEALYRAHGAAVSRRLIKLLSIIMSYAELRGRIAQNPLHRMQMVTPKGRRRTASWAEFDALEAAAVELEDNGMRLAMYLSMFQGQRATDTFEARAKDFIEDEAGRVTWRLIRSKDTRLGRLNNLVLHDETLPLVNAAIAAADSPHARLVTRRSDGASFDHETFSKAFADIRAIAAKTCPSVSDLQFRDLRRTFSDNARHAGIHSDDVDDALGNTSGTDPGLRQIYMPASDERAEAAINAIQRPQKSAAKKKQA